MGKKEQTADEFIRRQRIERGRALETICFDMVRQIARVSARQISRDMDWDDWEDGEALHNLIAGESDPEDGIGYYIYESVNYIPCELLGEVKAAYMQAFLAELITLMRYAAKKEMKDREED